MAKSKYSACAGEAKLENGVTVEVRYLSAAHIKHLFGKQPPFGPNRKRVGWYWSPKDPHAMMTGPYSSSTKALKAAIEANRSVKGA